MHSEQFTVRAVIRIATSRIPNLFIKRTVSAATFYTSGIKALRAVLNADTADNKIEKTSAALV